MEDSPFSAIVHGDKNPYRNIFEDLGTVITRFRRFDAEHKYPTKIFVSKKAMEYLEKNIILNEVSFTALCFYKSFLSEKGIELIEVEEELVLRCE